MKWIKASHRLPDKPGKYLFRVIGGGYDEDTAYYVQGVSEKDFEQWVKTSSKPASHEWLDETIARKDEAIAILNRLNESDYIKYEDGGYYHKDDRDGDNELTPEQLYKLFKKDK